MFRSIENKDDLYKGKKLHEKILLIFKRARNENNYFLKKTKLLPKKQKKSYENANICYTCKKNIESKYLKDKKNPKVRRHCHHTGQYKDAAHSICNLK